MNYWFLLFFAAIDKSEGLPLRPPEKTSVELKPQGTDNQFISSLVDSPRTDEKHQDGPAKLKRIEVGSHGLGLKTVSELSPILMQLSDTDGKRLSIKRTSEDQAKPPRLHSGAPAALIEMEDKTEEQVVDRKPSRQAVSSLPASLLEGEEQVVTSESEFPAASAEVLPSEESLEEAASMFAAVERGAESRRVSTLMRREIPATNGEAATGMMETLSGIAAGAFGSSDGEVVGDAEDQADDTSVWKYVVILLFFIVLLLACCISGRALLSLSPLRLAADPSVPSSEMTRPNSKAGRSSCSGAALAQSLLVEALADRRAIPAAKQAAEDVQRVPAKSSTRANVEALPLSQASEVHEWLQVALGYDCTLSRPISSRRLLRVQARVLLPPGGQALVSPLAQRQCVIYSASVSRLLHEGIHPVPVAHASASIDFCAVLIGSQVVQIEVSGRDVALFDMQGGRSSKMCQLAVAPCHWQDFVSAHEVPLNNKYGGPEDGVPLEFQECALLVGDEVTAVGELIRASDGSLSLQPFEGMQGREPWRTSWEADTAAARREEVVSSKVLVSDNPDLLMPSLGPHPIHL